MDEEKLPLSDGIVENTAESDILTDAPAEADLLTEMPADADMATEMPAEADMLTEMPAEPDAPGSNKAAEVKEKLLAAASSAKQSTQQGFGALKDKLGTLSNGKSKKKKKKPVKKRDTKPTIEQELADLAEEEAQFDEWGRPIRKKRRKKRKKSRKLSCTLVLLTLILGLSSVLSMIILAVAMEMYGIDKDVQEKMIVVPKGATVTSVAQQLVDENMVSLPKVFRLVSRMNGKDGSYIAGEHVLSASMSYEAMIEELCTNHEEEREYVRVTFREGISVLDAARILQENEVCKAKDFLFYFNSGGYGFKFEEQLPQSTNPLKFQRMEGYCFPDTYEFYVGEDPNIVAQKIYANFDSKITDGDYRKMKELGLTLDELITLASIVQGEAPSMDSMKMVASVFHNRLNNKAQFSQLQSDPTRKYAENVIAPNQEITNELMLTAYNTYAGQGLPPGAINNPGKEAIEATLYPESTGYYFFNANIDTGEIFYAVTYAEHQANLAHVQQQYAEAEAAANGNG